ncbi:MAG: cytochrome c [Gemmatimonadetes bacterium]|nr:MAG: cytochrome c [Gemmatimonadota bacterium]
MSIKDLKTLLALGMVAALAACGGADQGGDAGAPSEEPAAEAPHGEEGGEAPHEEGAGDMADMDLPEGVTAEMVAQGKEIFSGPGLCQACHGPGGDGSMGIAPKLADSEWLNIDGSYEAIVDLVMHGVPQPKQFPGAMPPKGGSQISDDQVKAVAAYVWTLSHSG